MTVSTGDKLTASLLNGLSGGGTRRAPMVYTLDQSYVPWTIWFDNQAGLQFPDYKTTATIYGYGFAPNINNTTWVTYPLVGNIISSSRGNAQYELGIYSDADVLALGAKRKGG